MYLYNILQESPLYRHNSSVFTIVQFSLQASLGIGFTRNHPILYSICYNMYIFSMKMPI